MTEIETRIFLCAISFVLGALLGAFGLASWWINTTLEENDAQRESDD